MINIPTTCGHSDSEGTFCKWGESGAHYYYTPGDESSMERARGKADAQGRAIRASGWTGKSEELDKSSDIQSLRFDKGKYPDSSSVVSWAKSHNFKSDNVEEMPNEWRLRQFDSSKCTRSGGMIDLAPGVRGYVCPIKEVNMEEECKDCQVSEDSIQKAINSLDNISKDLELLKKNQNLELNLQSEIIPIEDIQRIDQSVSNPEIQIEDITPSGAFNKQEEGCPPPQNVTEITPSGLKKGDTIMWNGRLGKIINIIDV